MNDLKEYVYVLINNEVKRVEDDNKAPLVATHRAIMDQVQCDINDAINKLKADGLITESINLNQMPLYSIIPTK